MLKRLRNWLAENRAWNEEHRRTWAGVAEPGPDGLSSFQRETEARVLAVLESRGMQLAKRRLVPTERNAEDYIVAEIPALNARISIYRDQTNVSSPAGNLRLEEWDARTPQEHHSKVVEFLASLCVPGDAE
jgi:hypothetical protein